MQCINSRIKYCCLILPCVLIISACANFDKSAGSFARFVNDATSENVSYNAYFCSQVDCADIIAKKLANASESVYCAFYSLKSSKILNALDIKSKNILTRVVIDSNNIDSNNLEQTTKNYAKAIQSQGLMHNKFCIIDDKIVITGSFNPVDASKDDNNIIVIGSKILAANYKAEFEELWKGISGKGEHVKNPILMADANDESKAGERKVKNYFCPEDNCAEKILDEINSAKQSVYFMVYSFTSEQIADALLYKNNVDVKGIVEKRQVNNMYSQYKRLKDFGVGIKTDNNKGLLHHKVFIIDNETVITGSFNPTASADTINDENILIIHDKILAKQYLGEFERVYN